MTEEIAYKQIINALTGEETLVPFTEEEMEELRQAREQYEAQRALEEEQARIYAEQQAALRNSAFEKLTSLGLTQEEINALTNR